MSRVINLKKSEKKNGTDRTNGILHFIDIISNIISIIYGFFIIGVKLTILNKLNHISRRVF